ncbi:MAG TPA: DUF1634 domain-containing protein [Desulfobulbaceae bacterium]|nr:DUF1634 domain-containing protein [Desulfobulbaceae bacterium]
MSEIKREATPEQLLYANILEKGMLVGLGLMFITFALYVLGIMKPVVPTDQIASYWSMPVHDYLVAINANFLHGDTLPTGWSWLKLISRGDFLNFIPIVILSGVTIICYIVIIPGLFARKDNAMGVIAVMTSLILILAASGILTTGGH